MRRCPLPAGLKNASKLPNPFTPGCQGGRGRPRREHHLRENGGDDRSDLATRIRDISIAIYKDGWDFALTKGIIIADTKFEFGLDQDGTLC